MQYALFGGDSRFAFAVEALEDMGREACLLPAEHRPKPNYLLVAGRDQIPAAKGLLATGASPRIVLMRGIPEEGQFSLENDEKYLCANARLTAEGAIAAEMGFHGEGLYSRPCLILGYGRIGRALMELLRGLHARPVAAVRRGMSQARAREDGVNWVYIEDIHSALANMAIIWNTIPERVISEELLERVKGRLIDLASPPYGFSLEQAQSLGLEARRFSGVPGIYCPRDAGREIARALVRLQNLKKVGDLFE